MLFAAAMVMGVIKMLSSWRKKQRELNATANDANVSDDEKIRHLVRTGRDIQAQRLFARVRGASDLEAEVAIRAIKRELGMP
jgi:hypothetical protein